MYQPIQRHRDDITLVYNRITECYKKTTDPKQQQRWISLNVIFRFAEEAQVNPEQVGKPNYTTGLAKDVYYSNGSFLKRHFKDLPAEDLSFLACCPFILREVSEEKARKLIDAATQKRKRLLPESETPKPQKVY